MSPSIPSRMTIGAVRNQPASLRFVLENSLSKTITSCRDSCSPNHLPRNPGCIITICKNQNIWYRKLITVSIFHCGVSNGIIAIFLQLRLRSNASMLDSAGSHRPTEHHHRWLPRLGEVRLSCVYEVVYPPEGANWPLKQSSFIFIKLN